MKRSLLIIALLCIVSFNTNACEICGCSAGNYYLGLLPNFKSRFIGIRYSFMNYHTTIANDPTQYSRDSYQNTEIWGGWNIAGRWQVLGLIPYQFNKKISDDGLKQTSGLGDISLLGRYSVLHTNNRAEQQLYIGAGIKIPTGSYRFDLTAPDANIGDANSQPGTGSTDFLLTVAYNISSGNLGLNNNLLYKITSANTYEYKFGNRLTAGSLVYYRLRSNGISCIPNIGLQYENTSSNKYNHSAVNETGGYLLNWITGIEIKYTVFTMGITAQIPLSQNFAEGQTKSKMRGLVHLSYSF